MKLLIIEDHDEINALIAEAFSRQGIACTQAFSGTEGLLYVKNNPEYDLIILDLMLPGLSGEALLPQIRAICDTPVLILSAKDELDGKVDLLEQGADDYITKPFEIKELLAKAHVWMRRRSAAASSSLAKKKTAAQIPPVSALPSDCLIWKGLRLDKSCHQVWIEHQELSLTKREFSILELLMSSPNKVFTKQEIFQDAWDEYYMGEDKTVNVHVGNIRRKIREFTDQEYIQTVWGIGFKMA